MGEGVGVGVTVPVAVGGRVGVGLRRRTGQQQSNRMRVVIDHHMGSRRQAVVPLMQQS